MESADRSRFLYGLNQPVFTAGIVGKILIFAPGATSLDQAIKTYAHELWHFHPTQSKDEALADRYGKAILKVVNGGVYNGPTP